ncbi:MAG: membrane protein insertase YidC [Acidobacteriota bacterium]
MLDKLSMEVRLLIAFVMMGLVLAVSQYLLPPPPTPPPTTATVETDKGDKPGAPANIPNTAPNTPELPTDTPAASAVSAAQEETVTIDTNLHHVVFSNRGAVVKSWVLKKFKDAKHEPLDLVNVRAAALKGNLALPAPMSLAFKTKPKSDLNNSLFRVTQNGLSVTFDYSDGRTAATKTFDFAQDTYLAKVSSQVIENGVAVPHSLVWRGGFGDSTVVNPVADGHLVYYDTSANFPWYRSRLRTNVTDHPPTGQVAFAGIEDKYFAAVMLPTLAAGQAGDQGGTLDITPYSDNVPKADQKEELRVGVAVGGSGTNVLALYVGPKDDDVLEPVDPRLGKLIDWGWFFFIAQPLFRALTWVTAHLTHNYGWAIIVATIIINTILFPLRLTSMKSGKKMQALKPQLDALNAKYKNMALTDPRKSEQQAEMMELHSKNGVNPVGGCLPMLVQIPVFFALYKVLSIAIEMRGAEWLWVADISQPETLAIRALPVILVASQFLTQKMTPAPGVDPTQQKMMLFMPLMFGYIFYYASAGLVLYYLTSNLVSIGQQFVMNRAMPTPAAVTVIPVSSKKKK